MSIPDPPLLIRRSPFAVGNIGEDRQRRARLCRRLETNADERPRIAVDPSDDGSGADVWDGILPSSAPTSDGFEAAGAAPLSPPPSGAVAGAGAAHRRRQARGATEKMRSEGIKELTAAAAPLKPSERGGGGCPLRLRLGQEKMSVVVSPPLREQQRAEISPPPTRDAAYDRRIRLAAASTKS